MPSHFCALVLLPVVTATVAACNLGGVPAPASPCPSPTAAAPTPARQESFTCGGAAAPADEAPPSVQVPAGRLEVKRIGKPLAAACTREKPCDVEAVMALRLRVIAEAIPLGTLGASLSSELGISVVTEAPLVGVRVSVALPDVSVRDLSVILRNEYRVSALFGGAELALVTRRHEIERKRAEVDLAPYETRIVPIPLWMSPPQIAATWCAHWASPHGTASVVGQSVVVVDRAAQLNVMDELVRSLSAPGKQ